MDRHNNSLNVRYPFSPFPMGWYAVAWFEHILPCQIVSSKICAKDIVIVKGEDGDVAVFDAHCPHLGAHLGYGGKLVDGNIKCPFHGWEFDSEGECKSVPYVSTPLKVSLKKWDSLIINGMVMVWWSESSQAPKWYPKPLDLDGWTQPFLDSTCVWNLRTHVQEIAENGFDLAHFPSVHGADAPGTLHNIQLESYKASWSSISKSNFLETEMHAITKISLEGLGVQRVFVNLKEKDLSIRTFLYITPLDHNSIIIRMPVSVPSCGDPRRDAMVVKLLIPKLAAELKRDFDIWENKKYVSRPPLSLADGPINKFREWAKIFYEN